MLRPILLRVTRVLPLLLVIAVFLGFALYGWGGAFPPGLNHDAGWMGLFALRILDGAPFAVYTPEAFGHETLYHYTLAAFFRVGGVSKATLELTSTFSDCFRSSSFSGS